MREIKFRAWDKDASYFKPLKDDGDYYFRDDGDGLILCDKWGECKNTILMQYTGLKDKKGTEIYEGDCLGHKSNVVEYLNGCFCINGDRPLSWLCREYEIVGNVYESPVGLQNAKESDTTGDAQ